MPPKVELSDEPRTNRATPLHGLLQQGSGGADDDNRKAGPPDGAGTMVMSEKRSSQQFKARSTNNRREAASMVRERDTINSAASNSGLPVSRSQRIPRLQALCRKERPPYCSRLTLMQN